MAPVVINACHTPRLNRTLKEDRISGPVRDLRYYLDRTEDFRRDKKLLLVSSRKVS